MRRALSLLLVVVGCDTSEPMPYTPIYDPTSRAPVSMGEFCTLLAKNACATLRPCCSSARLAFDEARCRANARAICEARRARALEVGLRYDDVQAGRCARGQGTLLRECSTTRAASDPVAADVAEACLQVFHGIVAETDACNPRATAPCAPPDLGVRIRCEAGICRVRKIVGAGEPCGVLVCEAGLSCRGTPARCLSPFVPVGGSCATSGSSCNDADDAYCDPATFVCTRYPTLGEACGSTNVCARPYRCDSDKGGGKVCVEGKALGAFCAEARECASRVCAESLRACLPAPFGYPLSGAVGGDPLGYVGTMAASCDGLLGLGGGGLAAVPLPQSPP